MTVNVPIPASAPSPASCRHTDPSGTRSPAAAQVTLAARRATTLCAHAVLRALAMVRLWASSLVADGAAAISMRVERVRRRWREEPDAGYSTETVVVTALLVLLAVAVLAIIATKITAKAEGIDLG